jgi:general stress protein YciG
MATNREISEAEFDRQYEEALREDVEPRAVEVAYRDDLGMIWIRLYNGCVFAFPPNLIQGLEEASEDVLGQVELWGDGCGLRWDTLDIDLSVPGLLMGSFGTRAWMQEIGRKGGRSTSSAKAEAARKNGLKGGRPASKPEKMDEPVPAAGPESPESGWLYWESTEAPAAYGVGAGVVAGDEGSTGPSDWRDSRSARTPSSRTPAHAA